MVDKRQALGIDIDNYARTGGTNFDLAAKHIREGVYDFLIIKAGLGMGKSDIFDEQRKYAENAGIPFVTYHLPDPDAPNKEVPKNNMPQQARRYVDWVGKNQPVYIVDIELPKTDGTGRLPTRKELLQYLTEFKKLTGKSPILYTRIDILEKIGFINDAAQYDLWLAQYLYVKSKLPAVQEKYRYIDDFLKDYQWTIPALGKWKNLAKNVILWQFTDKGDGPYYIYNQHTAHHKYKDGKKSADLNISIIGRDEFLKLIFGSIPDLPKSAFRVQGLTSEQLEKLAQAGITPNIQVDINIDDFEIEEFKVLQDKLDAAGISSNVKVKFRARINE
jgi:GH25 family lysozyme M1 (1,4-beta-N-acetylmuramidase)